MLLLQKIRANLLTATPKILSRFNNHSSGHYCTESKSPIEQESINNNVEEDTVFEVYDEHWEVNPVVEQLHISPKMRPEENLSFIRMENLFDIPELVEALKRENIRDIVCLNVDRNFLAPYMVIGNGVSKRHIQNTVVHIHKLKRDFHPKVAQYNHQIL
ncbi:Mitochondrial assembly of ribosomal large subunit protein 1 [Schistosoma haematobium]|uniref:Mitochondrial assembly of ribosomal large subunit protein 1 n=1 Tax=Schistosoma haematobium TaxID=6185 RepID=A0A922LG87_SCHHA|nr:Mitochondrial assembly of ribosomal large subunit protein 1 [Schistosoma haematobium]KAH9582679.1 Mitochondrial assembly of ribosomal large subunit protein 1 [Schistosoma haematobium]